MNLVTSDTTVIKQNKFYLLRKITPERDKETLKRQK